MLFIVMVLNVQVKNFLFKSYRVGLLNFLPLNWASSVWYFRNTAAAVITVFRVSANPRLSQQCQICGLVTNFAVVLEKEDNRRWRIR